MVEKAGQGVEPTNKRGVVATVEEVTVATTKRDNIILNNGERRNIEKDREMHRSEECCYIST